MLSNETTMALVKRVQQGDPEAFDALVRAYLRAAYLVALAVVGRPADAEDVAQEALLLAFERIDSCREPARFGGWLMQIARNQGRNFIARRRFREVPREETSAVGMPDAASSDIAWHRMALLEALAVITPLQREVVLLHDLEGGTHPEIAEVLGISVATSRWHLFYARRLMRQHLDGQTQKGGKP